MVQNNPIDNLDFESNQFKEGIRELALFLKVPALPDQHLVTLKAISLLIRNKISMESKDNLAQKSKSPGTITRSIFDDNDMGFKLGSDKVLMNSAKILRLLYLKDLRQLQTRINQLIVSVQSITANPKTDTSLGKVGK